MALLWEFREKVRPKYPRKGEGPLIWKIDTTALGKRTPFTTLCFHSKPDFITFELTLAKVLNVRMSAWNSR